MHKGTFARYARLYAELQKRPLTSLQVAQFHGTVAPATIISALRQHLLGTGETVVCNYVRTTHDEKKVFLYRLVND